MPSAGAPPIPQDKRPASAAVSALEELAAAEEFVSNKTLARAASAAARALGQDVDELRTRLAVAEDAMRAVPDMRPLDFVVREHVVHVLSKTGSVATAAAVLGISQMKVYRALKRWGVSPPPRRERRSIP